MKNWLLILTLPALCLIFACSSDNGKQQEQAANTPIDPRYDTLPHTFNNIYVAKHDTSDKKGLARTRFAIEYPDNVEVTYPDNIRDYVVFKLRENGVVIEELWISETAIRIPDKKEAETQLEIAVKTFRLSSPEMIVDHLGLWDWNGKNEYMLWCTTDFNNFNTTEYDGFYKVVYMIPIPERDYFLHSISVTMMANHRSPARTYKDFQDKALVSKIWKTFRYLE